MGINNSPTVLNWRYTHAELIHSFWLPNGSRIALSYKIFKLGPWIAPPSAMNRSGCFSWCVRHESYFQCTGRVPKNMIVAPLAGPEERLSKNRWKSPPALPPPLFRLCRQHALAQVTPYLSLPTLSSAAWSCFPPLEHQITCLTPGVHEKWQS